MNKVKLSALFIVGISIGFIVGFRYGCYEYVLWNSQNEAGKLTRELKQLKAGEYNKLIEYKEFDLNLQFYLHGLYLDSPLKILVPFKGGKIDQKIMENAVSYRKDNPYALKDLSQDKELQGSTDSEFLSNLHKGYEIQKTEIDKVERAYAK